MNGPIVGIDLGTTNSLVAVAGWPNPTDPPRVLADNAGSALMPSVVRFDDGGAVVVGSPARSSGPAHTGRIVASVKRLMGRSLADAGPDLPFLPFEVVAGEGDTARVRLPGAGGRNVTPQEVSAHILRALKERASSALGVPVERAVVTVPAYFDDAQRQATRDAARLAGLDAVRLVAEPTAAALAYGLGTRPQGPQNIVVYDLGGGTFDVSILRITPGSGEAGSGKLAADAFEVLATHGDTRLGGDDFDHAVVTWIVARALDANPQLPPPDAQSIGRLKALAERAKVELSSSESSAIDVGASLGGAWGSVPALTLARADLDGLIAPLVDRTIASCRRALRDAQRQMNGEPISAVILVGGATRTPLVRERVGQVFGLAPYTAIDPDQAVALGAAVQASIIGGGAGTAQALLLDVVPLSLGIETANGAFAKIIVRNAPIPAAGHEMFSTQVDGQTSVKLHVLQGEREMVADCRSLGEFHLRGIPPMPAGIPQLRVDFAVDANGLLTVSALERRSGKRLSVQIVPHHGLSRDEVERIERESFANALSDMSRHRIADLLANSRLDLLWINRQLTRAGGLVSAPQRAAIERGAAALQAFIDLAAADGGGAGVDPDAFHAAKEALDRASVPLHEASIKQSLAGETGAGGAGTAGGAGGTGTAGR
ncbi:MAG: Hsp70 family protein [Phycisphaerales bacterium]|nr:Hsp70 family protein [Phycisphaerales bacterium]